LPDPDLHAVKSPAASLVRVHYLRPRAGLVGPVDEGMWMWRQFYANELGS